VSRAWIPTLDLTRFVARTASVQRWQVSACIAALALCGCATNPAAPPRASATPPTVECQHEVASTPTLQPTLAPRSAGLAAAAGEPREGILHFDCGRADELEGQKLRDFSGGGPQGSAWNFYGGDLRCIVRMRTDCAAQLQTTLRVGERGRFQANSQLAAGDERTVELLVPSHAWEAESDSDAWVTGVAYSSLLFVARVDGLCSATAEEPQERPFHWSDSFVAGFSGGE
jgi:hypothetical protein